MEIIKSFVKYSLVGFSGFLINIVVYSLLIYLGFHYLLAASLSFLLAITNNFFWNFIWTFKGKGEHKSIHHKYFNFFSISLINFFFNILFLKFFHDNIGINKYISQVLAIVITSTLNFIGNYFITFKDKA